MLILARAADQSILIGEGDDRVEVMVVEVKGKYVRLGIKAPATVRIVRDEIDGEPWRRKP